MRTLFTWIKSRLTGKAAGQPADADALRRRTLEQLTGMTVRNVNIYDQALRHRSVLRGTSDIKDINADSNERLEFLGDAVLNVIVSRHLFEKYPDEDEGFLTRLRAKLVNGLELSRFARSIGLGQYVAMSENTESADGRENESILADAFEALIGALYLDLGYDAAETFVQDQVLSAVDFEALVEHHDNYKSMLLEFAQARGWPQPTYRVASERGPGHDRVFTVEVVIDNAAHGTGTAKSKKKAEQKAASMALSKLMSEKTTEGTE